jgi:hypothetical protein
MLANFSGITMRQRRDGLHSAKKMGRCSGPNVRAPGNLGEPWDHAGRPPPLRGARLAVHPAASSHQGPTGSASFVERRVCWQPASLAASHLDPRGLSNFALASSPRSRSTPHSRPLGIAADLPRKPLNIRAYRIRWTSTPVGVAKVGRANTCLER